MKFHCNLHERFHTVGHFQTAIIGEIVFSTARGSRIPLKPIRYSPKPSSPGSATSHAAPILHPLSLTRARARNSYVQCRSRASMKLACILRRLNMLMSEIAFTLTPDDGAAEREPNRVPEAQRGSGLGYIPCLSPQSNVDLSPLLVCRLHSHSNRGPLYSFGLCYRACCLKVTAILARSRVCRFTQQSSARLVFFSHLFV